VRRHGLELREVACLNGCLRPANLGLRGAGRVSLRFSEVTLADLDAFLECARAYWAAPPGADVAALIPRRLRRKAQLLGPPTHDARPPA
jgi:predicted metal-binding protein